MQVSINGQDVEFKTQIAHSVKEIGPEVWDRLSQGRPFSGYNWYEYGESCMAGSLPVYIFLFQDNQAVARATFWLTGDEPLPIASVPIRRLVKAYLHRRPLLLCRSPFSSSSGLILPDQPLREKALQRIVIVALEELHRYHGSFLAFDFLGAEEVRLPGWPSEKIVFTFADPGTRMELKWDSFDAYLAAGDKKDRQHFKRTMHQAEKLGIQITRHKTVPDIESSLALIRNLEKKYVNDPIPWAQNLLENIGLIDGTFLEARLDDRLVGCAVVAYDHDVQSAVLIGLADDIPYVYFRLLYAALQEAFEKNVRLLRWGSNLYEVKLRLGFEKEDNGQTIFIGSDPFKRLVGRLAVSR